MSERKHFMMDEFCPPSILLGYPAEKKTAWTEKNVTKEKTGPFYQYFCKFSTVYQYLGSFPVELARSSTKLKFSYTSILTLTSSFLPIVLIFTLQILYPEDDLLNRFMSIGSNLSPFLNKLLFFARFPSMLKLIKLMNEIDGSSYLEKPDPNVPKKNNCFVHYFGLCFWVLISFPHFLLTHEPTPENVNGYFIHTVTSTIILTQMSFLYVICYQMCYFFDRFHVKLEELVNIVCEEVTDQQVEQYRLVHAKLVTCVRLMDRTFGLWLAFVYVTMSVDFVAECYSMVYGGETQSLVALQVALILYFIFYPSVLCDRIYNKNSETIKFTFRMALKEYPEDVTFQIYYFMRQVKINVAVVNAGGMADVNKEIITKGLSLFATFFVATIQMQPQVQEFMSDLRNFLNTTNSMIA